MGIAVAGATDAAKNAADLILTEPGLSPIYGAVLESRRIFVRLKAYIVYRVAAAMTLSVTLSTIIFVTNCAVESLLIILLALFNDISMIAVAYDKANATTKPQLPVASKLVFQSLFYGSMLTTLSLIFLFGYDYGRDVDSPIDFDECDSSTTGFIWFHLVVVTEMAIFSVRAPSSVFFSPRPALVLVLSIFLTIVATALIAVLVNGLTPANMGIIIGVNAAIFVFVDSTKMWFRRLIKDEPGDIIESDELIPVDVSKTETEKHMEKKIRYIVHRESMVNPEDQRHIVQFVNRTGLKRFFTELRVTNLTGFVHNRRASSQLTGHSA